MGMRSKNLIGESIEAIVDKWCAFDSAPALFKDEFEKAATWFRSLPKDNQVSVVRYFDEHIADFNELAFRCVCRKFGCLAAVPMYFLDYVFWNLDDKERRVLLSLAEYLVIDVGYGPDSDFYPVRASRCLSDIEDEVSLKTKKIMLRKIRSGFFLMGSPETEYGRNENEVLHEVLLTKDYFMGVYEITQSQWECVMGADPSAFKGETRPVTNVSYTDVCGQRVTGLEDSVGDCFLSRLMKKSRLNNISLPTEAQWEYACRAGSKATLPNGCEMTAEYDGGIGDLARYSGNVGDGKGGFRETTEVGVYLSNRFGLFDMLGNVFEWCKDWSCKYDDSIVAEATPEQIEWKLKGKSFAVDPEGPLMGVSRIIRGGSCDSRYGLRRFCRPASRLEAQADTRAPIIGFRIALTLDGRTGDPYINLNCLSDEVRERVAPKLPLVPGLRLCDECVSKLQRGSFELCSECRKRVSKFAAELLFKDDAAIRRNLVRTLMGGDFLRETPVPVLNSIGDRFTLLVFAIWHELTFRRYGSFAAEVDASEAVEKIKKEFNAAPCYGKDEALRLMDEEVREVFFIAKTCGFNKISYTNEIALINIKKLLPEAFALVTDPSTGFSYVVSHPTKEDKAYSVMNFKRKKPGTAVWERFDVDAKFYRTIDDFVSVYRKIEIINDFYLAESPVTQRQWAALNGLRVDCDEMQTHISYSDLFGEVDWPSEKPELHEEKLGSCLRKLIRNGIELRLPTRGELEYEANSLPPEDIELCMDWRANESEEWWPFFEGWDDAVRRTLKDPQGPQRGLYRTLMECDFDKCLYNAIGLGVLPFEKVGPGGEAFGFRFCLNTSVNTWSSCYVIETSDSRQSHLDNVDGHAEKARESATDNATDKRGEEGINQQTGVGTLETLPEELITAFEKQGKRLTFRFVQLDESKNRLSFAVSGFESADEAMLSFASVFADMKTTWKPIDLGDEGEFGAEYVFPTASVKEKLAMQKEMLALLSGGRETAGRFFLPEQSPGSDQAYAPLKYEFYDAIESGEKTVEFREYNEGWAKKLLSRPMKTIKFSRGYGQSGKAPQQMVFAIEKIGIVDAHSEKEIPARHPDGTLVCEDDVDEDFMPTHLAIYLGARLS